MLLKAALSVGFLWSVALVVVGWIVSRRSGGSAFHFWFALITAEASRWSLTFFLLQNVGLPLYWSGQLVPYRMNGLYMSMGVMGAVFAVGVWVFGREKRFWPGGYYALSSLIGILALVIVRLIFL